MSLGRGTGATRPIAVILNACSGPGGTEATQQKVAELCAEAGCEVLVTTTRSIAELRNAVQAALAADVAAVLAGGGDGTLSYVAGFLAGQPIPLGVLPLGTLNHFAKDLGVPLELGAAVKAALEGHAEPIDVGEVNGRVFLNNASLGLYPLIVRLRNQHPVRGPSKWLVAVWATLREIRRHRELVVRIHADGEAVVRTTAILFIGNNEYRATGFDLGSRESLRAGRLAMYIVQPGWGRHPFRLAWRMLRGRAQAELELLLVEAATIETSRSRVPVAVDGEVESFESPLEFRIRPAALRVLIPAPLAESQGATGVLPLSRRTTSNPDMQAASQRAPAE